ncbi:MAG TPA: hypothetical protein VMV27_05120 [Candidatus Binataceae bacterium]|nr:hypothetical protein [Candidatus Binataceae bacterium]
MRKHLGWTVAGAGVLLWLAVFALCMCAFGAPAAQAQAQQSKADWAEAGRVLSRHEKELMAIPKVLGVSVSNENGDVNPEIVVWVSKPEDLGSVERAAPDSLEGFPVEVKLVGHAVAA